MEGSGLTWIEVADQLEVLISRLTPDAQAKWEWGETVVQSDEAHITDFVETLAKTREHFSIKGDTAISGVFVEGTDIKLAMTGNSPSAGHRAEYLSAVCPKNMTLMIAYIREKEAANAK
jgi:hypothetical protein